MNNSELQNMIQKYREELLKYAKENDGYISEEVMNSMPEAEPVVSIVSAPRDDAPPADITELEGTNPGGYNAGRDEPVYRNLADFTADNKGEGSLRVQAFSGREAFPIVNARVVVSKNFEEGSHIFYDEMTDISGIVDSMNLIAPSKDNAKQNNTEPILSTYTIRVTHPYYITTVYTKVPVFDGVTSIQPVNMLPRSGTPTDDNEIIYVEQEPTDL